MQGQGPTAATVWGT
uniref:Uncharacterized protein n=1 Tax=Arundo donax TaxID=35708 RepID=A0A0A9CK06_ARUDO